MSQMGATVGTMCFGPRHKKLRSTVVPTASSEIGIKARPASSDSYFVLLSNKGWPTDTFIYARIFIGCVLSCPSPFRPMFSCYFGLISSNCSRHSASVFTTFISFTLTCWTYVAISTYKSSRFNIDIFSRPFSVHPMLPLF